MSPQGAAGAASAKHAGGHHYPGSSRKTAAVSAHEARRRALLNAKRMGLVPVPFQRPAAATPAYTLPTPGGYSGGGGKGAKPAADSSAYDKAMAAKHQALG
jgi:hypothetical protein